MTVSGPWWAWALGVGGALVLIVLTVIASVEVAISRRLREIKTMFRDALLHATSFDSTIREIREERKRDRETLVELLQILGKHTDELAKMQKWQDGIDDLNIIRSARQTFHG